MECFREKSFHALAKPGVLKSWEVLPWSITEPGFQPVTGSFYIHVVVRVHWFINSESVSVSSR